MGTRADFYVGRGAEAEWLGSIAWDGYPEKPSDIGADLRNTNLEAVFRGYVRDTLSKRDDFTDPQQGWPWPWDTSFTTDCAYAFDAGRVFIERSRRWVPLDLYLTRLAESKDRYLDEETWDDCEPAVFPDMSARKNVTLGGRSGLIVLGTK